MNFFKKISIKLTNTIIKVYDYMSNTTFSLILREDCYIEKEVDQFGLYGYFEKESLKLWAFLSKKSNVIIDIGANTGIYSILAFVNNNNAKILAIEPIDTNFKVLNNNVLLNDFTIHTEKVALSNKKGAAKMFMFKDKLNYMTSIDKNRYEENPEVIQGKEIVEVSVKLEMFTNLFEKYNLDNLDLIKIDVEGHEVEVLFSMIDLIERFRPSILVEILTDEIASKISLFFNKFDYFFISIDEQTKPKRVKEITNNQHHNYLLCQSDVFNQLLNSNLITNE